MLGTTTCLSQYQQGRLKQGTYHLTAGSETSWHGFAKHVLRRAKSNGIDLCVDPSAIEPIPTSAFPTPATRPANSRLCTASLEAALGIRMPEWRLHADQAVDRLTLPTGV